MIQILVAMRLVFPLKTGNFYLANILLTLLMHSLLNLNLSSVISFILISSLFMSATSKLTWIL